ncbi:hypothetical protein [Sulfitobacter sp.]|uniref:hypothetical protein n=1 Tax=Sulfitobacter sp. TaxID=1903071 RepID=UPI003EF1C83B
MPSDVNTYRSYALPWRNMHSDMLEGVEIFAIGDVQGQADLLAEILHEIRNTPREASIRHLVFLGNLTDRGPASIRAVDLAVRTPEWPEHAWSPASAAVHDIPRSTCPRW